MFCGLYGWRLIAMDGSTELGIQLAGVFLVGYLANPSRSSDESFLRGPINNIPQFLLFIFLKSTHKK